MANLFFPLLIYSYSSLMGILYAHSHTFFCFFWGFLNFFGSVVEDDVFFLFFVFLNFFWGFEEIFCVREENRCRCPCRSFFFGCFGFRRRRSRSRRRGAIYSSPLGRAFFFVFQFLTFFSLFPLLYFFSAVVIFFGGTFARTEFFFGAHLFTRWGSGRSPILPYTDDLKRAFTSQVCLEQAVSTHPSHSCTLFPQIKHSRVSGADSDWAGA